MVFFIKKSVNMPVITRIFLLFVFFVFVPGDGFSATDGKTVRDIVLADFESKIPCSECGDNLGYRRRDAARGELVKGGADGTAQSAVFSFDRNNVDLYFQGDVRRKYLATGTAEYVDLSHNALSFWVKIPEDSPLLSRVEEIRAGDRVIGRKVQPGALFNVWTYHWRQGDMGVGGPSNHGLATDSNMHGYADFRFEDSAAGQWVNVVLTPSAFRQSRNYYQFYAGRANTDELCFFGSLRQLQIRLRDPEKRSFSLQLDEVKLTHLPPVVQFDREFHRAEVPAKDVEYRVPVRLTNPTDQDRRYRVFISSNLGLDRELLSTVFGLTDAMAPMREMQIQAGSGGGIGVVKLVDDKGKVVEGPDGEFEIAAGQSWKGTLVHHIKAEMLGEVFTYRHGGYEFDARRDTLTTSVIVWDPQDEGTGLGRYIKVRASNADDGNHRGPPGFPRQKRPAEGWRSENIPLDQAGGDFVTVIRLVE